MSDGGLLAASLASPSGNGHHACACKGATGPAASACACTRAEAGTASVVTESAAKTNVHRATQSRPTAGPTSPDEPGRSPGLSSRAARTGALIRRLRFPYSGSPGRAAGSPGRSVRSAAITDHHRIRRIEPPCSPYNCVQVHLAVARDPGCGTARLARLRRRAGHRLRQGPLHQVRVPDPDARRRAALHRGLRAQGPIAALPDPALPHSLQRSALRRRCLQVGPRPLALFGNEGYIVVYQDVRGRWMSEGEFVNMRPHRTQKHGPQDIDESTDTYDTIDWLIKNVPNNNGKVGMWGISYPGFYTAAGMIDAHPALKAASPQAPVTDWFAGDDWHHNGALFLPHAFNFLVVVRPPAPRAHEEGSGGEVRLRHARRLCLLPRDGPARQRQRSTSRTTCRSGTRCLQHANYDEFWAARNLRPHLKNIRPAVMTVGGWFDAENLFGALETYRSVEASSPGTTNVLVMGPWLHGGWARRRRCLAGPGAVQLEDRGAFSREHRVPVLPVLSQGKRDAELSRSLGLRDRHEPVARV